METIYTGPFQSHDLPFIDAVNDTVEPYFFVHLTDVHFCAKKEWAQNAITTFKAINNTLDPPLIVFTGDLTDGSATTSITEFRHQVRGNWEEYQKAVDDYLVQDDRTIFAIAGNHDFYSLGSDSTSFYREFVLKDDSDYRTRKLLVTDTPVGNISFVGFVPMPIPFTNAPFGSILHLPNSYFDLLDAQYENSTPNILLVHFPPESILTSGNVKENVYQKAQLILDGHYHPTNPVITHCGQTTSVMSPAGLRSDKVGLITFERGAVVYNEMHPREKKIELAISYPIPSSQISGHSVFNIRSFSIRLLAFENPDINSGNLDDLENLNIEAAIDGKNVGTLNFRKRVRRSAAFYSLPVENVRMGKHTLTLSGKEGSNIVDREIEFYVGNTKKKSSQLRVSKYEIAFVYYGIFVFLGLVRGLPWWLLGSITEKLEEFTKDMFSGPNEPDQKGNEEMEGSEDTKEGEEPRTNRKFTTAKRLGYGLLDQWSRLRRAPPLLIIFMAFLSVFVFILPLCFLNVGGNTQTAFSWGLIVHNFNHGDPMTFMFGILFYLFYYFPLTIIIGDWFENYHYHAGIIVEMVLSFILITIILIAWIIVSVLAGGVVPFFASFVTWLLYPIFFLILWVLIRNRFKWAKAQPVEGTHGEIQARNILAN